jgi:hypothetical protein
VKSEADYRALLKGNGNGFSSGEHGTVEFTAEFVEASRNLSTGAIKVFGKSRIHEKSAEEVARDIAFNSNDADSVKAIAKAVVTGIKAAATTEYRVIRPNPLFRFVGNVEEIKIGPVRIATREAVRRDVEGRSSAIRICSLEKENNAVTFIEDGASLIAQVYLPELCWDVSVQGMPKGLELEAVWFIDVAISFVRLHYQQPKGFFPTISDVEPHPIHPRQFQAQGLSIGPDGATLGGGSAAPWYEIDADMVIILKSSKVVAAAEQLFAPHSNTLAERMQQALGWLTRARRAYEPAERMLLFFTTIEALLSGTNKDGPITESIARNAGVIWSADPKVRMALYKSLKKLYDLRSRIVHNGERSVAQLEVNNIHYIAWTITQIILRRADLSARHSDFIETLKEASFGEKLEI